MVLTSHATYRTSKARTKIDDFLMSSRLALQVDKCEGLKDNPMKPHMPVKFVSAVTDGDLIPVFVLPPRLLLDKPIGPLHQIPDWSALDALIEEASQYLNRCDQYR